jgi:hypothetical protein
MDHTQSGVDRHLDLSIALASPIVDDNEFFKRLYDAEKKISSQNIVESRGDIHEKEELVCTLARLIERHNEIKEENYSLDDMVSEKYDELSVMFNKHAIELLDAHKLNYNPEQIVQDRAMVYMNRLAEVVTALFYTAPNVAWDKYINLDFMTDSDYRDFKNYMWKKTEMLDNGYISTQINNIEILQNATKLLSILDNVEDQKNITKETEDKIYSTSRTLKTHVEIHYLERGIEQPNLDQCVFNFLDNLVNIISTIDNKNEYEPQLSSSIHKLMSEYFPQRSDERASQQISALQTLIDDGDELDTKSVIDVNIGNIIKARDSIKELIIYLNKTNAQNRKLSPHTEKVAEYKGRNTGIGV